MIDLLADKVGRQLKKHLGKVKAKKIRVAFDWRGLQRSRGDLIAPVAVYGRHADLDFNLDDNENYRNSESEM